MASTSVVFDIIAKDRASDKFDHLSRSVDHSGGALGKFASIAGHAAKVGAVALAGGAVLAAKGLYEAAQGAVEDQAAAAKLAKTLQTVAHATDGQIASTEDWITAQGKAYGVADDDLRPSLQRLAEATHDVGKAQDLASLAMDVAAAKGKPLTQVSEALMKAYNGNIGALGRLGIKTKDAAGETISFDEATKQMADTFGGAASAHADTLAGKMEILKLQISEAGESIGYKLLPYAADAADWLGDHLPGALDTLDKKAGPVFASIVDGAGELKSAVTPLVSELAEAFGHLTDEGGGAGDMWEDKLLPAIKNSADVLAKVVDIVDDLPAPVKSMGVEVGIAALAFGKLNGALGGVVPTMDKATGATGKLMSVTRQAAGVGGLLALTHGFADAKSQGDKFMGVLEGFAGGAALGFAAGGPIGALIGATAGGGLMGLTAAFSDTEAEARDARRELMKSEGFADAKADADLLVTALQGVVNEYGNVSIATVKNSLIDPETGNLVPDAQVLSDLGVDMDTIAASILGQKDALGIVNDAWDGYGDTLQQNVSDAEQHVADLAQLQTDYAQRGPGDPVIDPPSADELADAGQAVKDAQDALDDFNASQSVFNERTHQGSAAIKEHQKTVRGLTHDLGITREQYDKWPKAVRTQIEADNLPQTSSGLLRLIGHYKGLQTFKKIETLVSAPGAKLSADDIVALQKKYGLTQKEVKTLVNLESGGATSDIDRYRTLLSNLDSPPNDVNNYIYTHPVSTGGGGGGGADIYDDSGGAPRKMALPTIPQHPQSTAPERASMTATQNRRQVHVHVHLGGREIKHYVEDIADDRIDQAREFDRTQR